MLFIFSLLPLVRNFQYFFAMKRSEIIAQQRLYLSFLPHVRKQFGNLSGVATIGLGAKEKNGLLLEEWSFRFYVQNKRPLKDIPVSERIPDRLFGIRTDVLPVFETDSLICDSSVLSIDDQGYRDTGLRGGISIRNEHFDNDQPSGFGTLGVLARRKSDNAIVGLTCAHVVNAGSTDLTVVNTKIGQPKYWISCCCCTHGYIGDVAKATSSADLDCAIIDIHDDLLANITTNSTENQIEGIGNISGAAAILCFDNLRKRGRATGLTTGKVSDIAFGTDQMLIERIDGNPGDPFACQGDSGSVIVNSGNQVVGLLVAASRHDRKKTIATHIKPVMAELGITIAGTDVSDIGEPVGGGLGGCELFAWPGGQSDTAMNPVEVFDSIDFGFAGNVDWDVSGGAPGATIIQTGSQTASGLSTITVRYDQTSATSNPTDAVWIKAINGSDEATKFRTVFTLTPRAVNTSGALDSDNTKRFPATGGIPDHAGVAIPGTEGASWYLAKAEIAFEVTPAGMDWSNSGGINFVTGAHPGIDGVILARRETRFTRGEQATGAANRTHTDQPDWISAGDSSVDDFQSPTAGAPDEVFRLGTEGFDPTNLLQAYLRGEYRDYLEFHDGTTWVRITPYAEWFANLTADQNGGGTAPPSVGAPNSIGAGTNSENLPNQKPTITVGPQQEVRPGEVVTLTATPADADNDVLSPAAWTQTAGPAVALSSPTGNSVTFTAPANDPQLKFTAITSDNTQGLSRASGNHQSDPAEVIINVVEWKNIGGGDPIVGRNMTEVFNAADFGIGAGALNWDVTTGGTDAVIIEADGAPVAATGTLNGATTITVRYDTRSGDISRAQSVKIQAVHPGNGRAWFKRRTVFRVTVAVHATDTHTHRIPSMQASGKDHFVSAQGMGDSTFVATFDPVPPGNEITWDAGVVAIVSPAVGGARDTARMTSNTGTGERQPFTISVNGDLVNEDIFWTVWGTFGSTIKALATVVSATTISTSGGYDFTFTIQPAAIIPPVGTIDDVPDLRGARVSAPPNVPGGDAGVYQQGTALGGGATRKWDTTRRVRQRILNPNGVAWDPGTPVRFRTTYLNFPSDPIVGNDDTHEGDPEDNNPYTMPGHRILTGSDEPTDGLNHTQGNNGDSVEIRFHCQEFARLELDGNWYQISSDYLWKIHWNWNKTAGSWADNGSFLALDNNGF